MSEGDTDADRARKIFDHGKPKPSKPAQARLDPAAEQERKWAESLYPSMVKKDKQK